MKKIAKSNQNVSRQYSLKEFLIKLKPFKFSILLSILLSLVVSVAMIFVPIIIGKSIDLIVGESSVDFKKLTINLVILFITILVIVISQWLTGVINNRITYKLNLNTRNELFDKIHNLPAKTLDMKTNGETVSLVVNDVEIFGEGILLGLNQLFTGLFTIIGVLVAMFCYNVGISIMVLLMTPISIFVAKFITTKTFNKFKEQANIRSEQTAFVEEMVKQQKVVQIFSHQEQNQIKFDEINNRLKNSAFKANLYSSLTNPVTRFVNAMIYAAVAIFSVILIQKTYTFTIGMMTTILSYVNQFTKPFNEVSGVVTELQNSLACSARITNFLKLENMADESNLKELDLKGNMKFENVNFGYEKDKPVLKDLNFEIKAGQKVSIVGPTGCGKTTIINLLMKFYNIDSGRILYDGIDISEIKRESIRDSIGMVLQESWIKGGTIKQNILFGKKDIKDDELKNVLKLSQCDGFVEKLPNTVNYEIFEDGGVLSQGEKQLLCIARLMLRNKPIIILDEATSNVDTRTELKIQAAFDSLLKNKTSFIVAHRLSTIQSADLILVLDGGKIVESGKHSELLKNKGFYYNLYQSQFES